MAKAKAKAKAKASAKAKAISKQGKGILNPKLEQQKRYRHLKEKAHRGKGKRRHK